MDLLLFVVPSLLCAMLLLGTCCSPRLPVEVTPVAKEEVPDVAKEEVPDKEEATPPSPPPYAVVVVS